VRINWLLTADHPRGKNTENSFPGSQLCSVGGMINIIALNISFSNFFIPRSLRFFATNVPIFYDEVKTQSPKTNFPPIYPIPMQCHQYAVSVLISCV
jgi:hypothetical protein